MSNMNAKSVVWAVRLGVFLLPLASFIAMIFGMNSRSGGVTSFAQVEFGMIFLAIPFVVLGIVGYLFGHLSARYRIHVPVQYCVFCAFLVVSWYLGAWVGKASDF